MNRMGAMMGKDPMGCLQLLEGASPESRGLLNREDPLLCDMYDLLVKSDTVMELLRSEDAAWALDCLLHMPGEWAMSCAKSRSSTAGVWLADTILWFLRWWRHLSFPQNALYWYPGRPNLAKAGVEKCAS